MLCLYEILYVLITYDIIIVSIVIMFLHSVSFKSFLVHFIAAFAVGQNVQLDLVVAPNRLFFVEQEFKRLLVQALRSKKKHGNFQYYGPFFMLGLRLNRLHVNASLLSKSSLF